MWGGASTEGAWVTQLARVALRQNQRQFFCKALVGGGGGRSRG